MSRKVLVGGVVLLLVVAGIVLGVVFPRPVERALSAFPGADFLVPRISFNGVPIISFDSALNNATSTLCSFRPRATSTLVFASARVDVSTSTDFQVAWGKALNNNTATTTLLAERAESTNGLTLVLNAKTASTSASGAADSSTFGEDLAHVFGPNDYLNFKLGAGFDTLGSSAANAFVGRCRAQFLEN